MNETLQKLNAASWIGCLILLFIILLKINMTQEALQSRDRVSGQRVESGIVTTERFHGETLEDWGARHQSALRAFKEDK